MIFGENFIMKIIYQTILKELIVLSVKQILLNHFEINAFIVEETFVIAEIITKKLFL